VFYVEWYRPPPVSSDPPSAMIWMKPEGKRFRQAGRTGLTAMVGGSVDKDDKDACCMSGRRQCRRFSAGFNTGRGGMSCAG